ncbi:two-component sensor histidine kinase [Streptomyces antimycoticus]|uniref:Oxygen sensor histidine kinase NreB n=1 Tax=Streptomyces antimycoticus TaxID=68175 RepID=A0A499V2B6_9ACTN|nr:sensor histidine kinase [Streptomyces antimycoticus]BBJ43701.1 two-component sensor histidine kinase [Streptomyces antimycoticus]
MRNHSPGEGSQTGAYYGPESGTRWFGLWDGFFAVSYLVTAILLFLSSGSQASHSIPIAALTLCVPWYAAVGRTLMIEDTYGPRNLVFAAGLVTLFCITTAFNLVGAFALFAVIPMLIMSLPMISAVVLATVANLCPVLVVAFIGEDLGLSVLGVLPISLLSIALSMLLGLWIKRVVRQSKGRGQLIEELQRSRERVARLSHEAGISAERERLAREIHDTLAQGLTSIISLVQAAESEVRDAPDQAVNHLSLAGRVAKESLAEARDFVAALTPPALRGGSLSQAVHRQAEGLIAETGLEVRCSVMGEERSLPMAVSVVLLRTVQEAIANVRKHAKQARTVDVIVLFDQDSVRLVVRDDGEGFTPDGTQEGYGLRGMQARVEEIDGVASVTSSPGRGTTVEVSVPVTALTGEAVSG